MLLYTELYNNVSPVFLSKHQEAQKLQSNMVSQTICLVKNKGYLFLTEFGLPLITLRNVKYIAMKLVMDVFYFMLNVITLRKGLEVSVISVCSINSTLHNLKCDYQFIWHHW